LTNKDEPLALKHAVKLHTLLEVVHDVADLVRAAENSSLICVDVNTKRRQFWFISQQLWPIAAVVMSPARFAARQNTVHEQN
jgi:hypothetical protein